MSLNIPCPRCGGPDCILACEEVLQQACSVYAPCSRCPGDPPLDKFTPLVELGLDPAEDTGRCPACGKRYLDHAMAAVLGVLIEEGVKDAGAALKDVGTPLVALGVPMAAVPRLPPKSVVMVIDGVSDAAAARILREVPEVRGVLDRRSRPSESVGLLDTGSRPLVYGLKAGCDMRADLVSCLLGDLCMYRGQSDCHVEFNRNGSVKVRAIERLYLDGLLEGGTVVDGFASVGTLGLLAALGGAEKVVLNDAWLPAIRNILLNLEVNRGPLDIEITRMADTARLPLVGDEPVLVARASGPAEIEVYQGDFRKLDRAVPACDVCIIDTFPGVDPGEFARKWRGLAAKKVLTL